MKTIRPLVFAAIAIGAFAACKKDRTCSCTVTKTGEVTTTAAITFSVPLPLPVPPVGIDTTFTSPVSESYSSDTKMEDVKKGTAKDNCFSYSEPYQETTSQVVPNFTLSSVNKGTVNYNCQLK